MFIIRNTDENCLYAALLVSYVLKSSDMKMTINNVEYKFSEDSFRREFTKYEDCKTKNLYFYTYALI